MIAGDAGGQTYGQHVVKRFFIIPAPALTSGLTR
jgi:hypothetical protein